MKHKTFVFSYKRVVQITVYATDKEAARLLLKDKIDQARSLGIELPRYEAYEILNNYLTA